MKTPKHLSKKSAEIWKDIERLSERKLNQMDYAIIESFCMELDVYDEATRQIIKSKELVSKKGNQVDPLITVKDKAAHSVRQLYKQISGFIRTEEKGEPGKLKSVKNF